MSNIKELEAYWLEKDRTKQLAQVLEELEVLEKKKKYTVSDWIPVFEHSEYIWVFWQREVYEKWERLLKRKRIDRSTYEFLTEKLEAIYTEEALESNKLQNGVLPEKDLIAVRLKSAYEKPKRTFELSEDALSFLKKFFVPAIPALIGAIWMGSMEYEEQKEQEQRAKYEPIVMEVWDEAQEKTLEEIWPVNIQLADGIYIRSMYGEAEAEKEKIIFNEITDWELISNAVGEPITANQAYAFEIREKEEKIPYSVYMSVSELGLNENSRVYIYDGTVCKEIKLWQGQETEDGCRLYNLQDYWALDVDFPSENDSSSKKVILVR